jgi:AraC-like DNA-binding protein
MNRRVVDVAPGVLRIEQRVRVRGRAVGTDVSGPACICARVQLARGSVSYLGSPVRVSAPGVFLVLLPPFAIVQATLARCDASTTAVALRPPARVALPRQPILVPWDEARPLPGTDEALEAIWQTGGGVAIGRAASPHAIAAHGKDIIDGEYATPIAMSTIAARLGTSPSAFARVFRGAYGIPPVRYRHQVRIVDALLRLADGDAPIDVGQDVGFGDLSRFYKIFRRVACAPPGMYRGAQSRNAKT